MEQRLWPTWIHADYNRFPLWHAFTVVEKSFKNVHKNFSKSLLQHNLTSPLSICMLIMFLKVRFFTTIHLYTLVYSMYISICGFFGRLSLLKFITSSSMCKLFFDCHKWVCKLGQQLMSISVFQRTKCKLKCLEQKPENIYIRFFSLRSDWKWFIDHQNCLFFSPIHR